MEDEGICVKMVCRIWIRTEKKMKNKTTRIKELIEVLNRASEAYYAKDEEMMSNLEYDALYDELVRLEEETGLVFSNSPTVNVGYAAVDELPKEAHEKPMLSLGKTKDREELRAWLKGQKALLSWKLDGLTVVLTYQNGELVKGVTRGNGEVGEVITGNVKAFTNVPLKIPFEGDLVLRGEAVISYSDFEKINNDIQDDALKYKNPRNLCSGSVRQLSSEITAKRKVQFYAFALVKAEGIDFHNSVEKQFTFLKEQGFAVVDYKAVTEDTIVSAVASFAEQIREYDIPSDGLVLTLDDIAYGESLGMTAKFPRNAIAFKWADEIRETTLLSMEWSPSRTGLINPVAIFAPVELEGTTVSRASVHNLSILKELKLGIGDTIRVYKANMIIPQIAENLTGSGNLEIPDCCPVCKGATTIRKINDTEALFCMNAECEAKKIKAFSHFVSRDAMNIEGMSEATLEKFIAKGFIHDFSDIYHLERYRNEIVSMEGFGEKSYVNLMESINKTRNCALPSFINALGIANVGLATSKLLCKFYGYSLEKLMDAEAMQVSQIEGIGDVIAGGFCNYMQDEKNRDLLQKLAKELTFDEAPPMGAQPLEGKTFVVTGSLIHYASRNDLKAEIEALGGKVAGSVSKNTECLINNDTESSSSKNKKAKELGIPILSEDEFLEKYMKE